MYKPKFGKNSPLTYHRNETQGTYWDRLVKIAEKGMSAGRNSRYFIKRLAFIMNELPSDVHWNIKWKDSVWGKAHFFLVVQSHEVRGRFVLESLKLNMDYGDRGKQRTSALVGDEELVATVLDWLDDGGGRKKIRKAVAKAVHRSMARDRKRLRTRNPPNIPFT